MAVEAPHLHLFSSSPGRDFSQSYDSLMDSDYPMLSPFHQSPDYPFPNFSPNKLLIDKDGSGLIFNNAANHLDFNIKPHFSDPDPNVNPQMHLYQSEVDRFIAEHNHKLRIEVEQRRNNQSRILASSIRRELINKVNQKDTEIRRIRKLNWFLRERMKRLYIENQIWRDLAQNNEATANSLRNNLEQVMAHVSGGGGGEDAESKWGGGGEEEERKCKKCGKREERVVVMPCRHLCLCAVCGSSLVGNCPVCNSAITATVHINLS